MSADEGRGSMDDWAELKLIEAFDAWLNTTGPQQPYTRVDLWNAFREGYDNRNLLVWEDPDEEEGTDEED
jgi:hypothetical protein